MVHHFTDVYTRRGRYVESFIGQQVHLEAIAALLLSPVGCRSMTAGGGCTLRLGTAHQVCRNSSFAFLLQGGMGPSSRNGETPETERSAVLGLIEIALQVEEPNETVSGEQGARSYSAAESGEKGVLQH